MAVKRRIMEICWDVVNKTFRDFTTGAELGTEAHPAYIYYHEKPLMRLKLVKDAALTACTDYTDLSLYAILKESYDRTLAPLCENLAETINVAGDWVSNGTANQALGQFTFQMNGFTVPFRDRASTNYNIRDSYFTLFGLTTSCGDIVNINEFPMDALNIRISSGGTPADTDTYPNWAQAIAAFQFAPVLVCTKTTLPIGDTVINLGSATDYQCFRLTGIVTGDSKQSYYELLVLISGGDVTLFPAIKGDDITDYLSISADISSGTARITLSNTSAARSFVYGVDGIYAA